MTDALPVTHSDRETSTKVPEYSDPPTGVAVGKTSFCNDWDTDYDVGKPERSPSCNWPYTPKIGIFCIHCRYLFHLGQCIDPDLDP